MARTRRHTRAAARTPDAVAITAVAWARVGIAVGVAAGGSLPHTLSSSHRALFLIAGLLWVPWSVIVLFASETPDRALTLIGGPLGDLVFLFACQVLAPSTSYAVIPGYLVVIAFAAYSFGRRAAGSRAAVRVARLQSASDAVLARIADGVVVTDEHGVVRSCNPAAERLLGADAVALVGSVCHVALDLRAGEARFDCSGGCRLLADANPVTAAFGHEVWRPGSDRRQPILANATPVLDERGEVVEVVHSLRDITTLKQSEEAKTLFLATASHELKTPLTVIRGFVETLLSTDMDEERRHIALDAVHRRALELGNIVDRLLLSSRIEAGRVDLLIGNVELRPLIEERAGALSAATGRVIEVLVEPEIGSVRGDDAALATVFEHLVDNAIKYSPGGGPIRVEAFGHERVVVTVSDDGIGMTAEHAQHCFDKFWQAEAGDVRRFGGTGIGLYIVRSLVDAMGGRISVESAIDEGTTFAVELLPATGKPTVPDDDQRGVGESTSIREFMRQIGVPERRPA